MLKKFTLSFTAILLSSLLIITSVSADSIVNVKSKGDAIKKQELEEKLKQEDMGIMAIVVDLPGPLAYSGTIPNHVLPQIISSRDKKASILNWMSIGLGAFTVPGLPAAGIPAGYMGLANSVAGQLAGSPTDRYQSAYDRGESVYYGAYYPTPTPGLTTVPFIYYSTTKLIYQYN